MEREAVLLGLSQALGSSKVLQTGVGSVSRGCGALPASDVIRVASYI